MKTVVSRIGLMDVRRRAPLSLSLFPGSRLRGGGLGLGGLCRGGGIVWLKARRVGV